MYTEKPLAVRNEIHRMQEALRTSVRDSLLSDAQVEEKLGMRAGYLNGVFAGKTELRVAHVFGILQVIESEPRGFFLGLLAGHLLRQ